MTMNMRDCMRRREASGGDKGELMGWDGRIDLSPTKAGAGVMVPGRRKPGPQEKSDALRSPTTRPRPLSHVKGRNLFVWEATSMAAVNSGLLCLAHFSGRPLVPFSIQKVQRGRDAHDDRQIKRPLD